MADMKTLSDGTHIFNVYDGSAYHPDSDNNLDLDGGGIVNVKTPVNDSDAATKEYVDTKDSANTQQINAIYNYIDRGIIALPNNPIRINLGVAQTLLEFDYPASDIPIIFLNYTAGYDDTYTAGTMTISGAFGANTCIFPIVMLNAHGKGSNQVVYSIGISSGFSDSGNGTYHHTIQYTGQSSGALVTINSGNDNVINNNATSITSNRPYVDFYNAQILLLKR